MANTKSVREAHREFSRLSDAAERGDVTVITRRGRPVAALMPIHDQKVSVRRQLPITHLRGTGKGMWGKDSRRFIRKLRSVWDRSEPIAA